MPYPVDTCSPAPRAPVRTTRGYSVPHHRLSLWVGPHASPGFSGVYLGRMETRPALILAILAQANNPRKLVQPHDDSDMGSCTCPCTALLGGIPSRMLSDRLLSPLVGLMVSRDPRGYAFTSTPEEQELHLHGNEVVKDPMILALYPLPSCEEGSFRDTDRTSTALLGAGYVRDPEQPADCMARLSHGSVRTNTPVACTTSLTPLVSCRHEPLLVHVETELLGTSA